MKKLKKNVDEHLNVSQNDLKSDKKVIEKKHWKKIKEASIGYSF